jgi:hypothetical protein
MRCYDQLAQVVFWDCQGGEVPANFLEARKLTQAKQFHCVKTLGCGRWRSDSPKRQRRAGRVLVLRRLV